MAEELGSATGRAGGCNSFAAGNKNIHLKLEDGDLLVKLLLCVGGPTEPSTSSKSQFMRLDVKDASILLLNFNLNSANRATNTMVWDLPLKVNTQVAKRFSAFVEAESAVTFSQKLAIEPPTLVEFTLLVHITSFKIILKIFFYYLFPLFILLLFYSLSQAVYFSCSIFICYLLHDLRFAYFSLFIFSSFSFFSSCCLS